MHHANFRAAHRQRHVRRFLTASTLLVAASMSLASPAGAAPAPPPNLPSALDDFSPYEGAKSCASAQPGALALRDLINQTYGTQSIGIVRACPPGGIVNSEHHEGRAVDWMLDAPDPRDRALADDFLTWLQAPDSEGRPAANARRLGVMYIIWDKRMLRLYQLDRGWQPYTGPDPHTNHIHLSLSLRGAARESSWWTKDASAINSHWLRLGGDTSALGRPTSAEKNITGGRQRAFQNGFVTQQNGVSIARSVQGAIAGAVAGSSTDRLGFAVTDELATPDKVGRYNHFERGSVYWTSGTGAQVVLGAIRDEWARLGWEKSYLKYPTQGDTPLPTGAYTHFQGGSIYWSPSTGAHAVRGAIRDEWALLGWEKSPLGYPTSSETSVRGGAFNHFQGGSIYWSPSTGAHTVRGAIRDKWASLGWEAGKLGYPTSGDTILPTGAYTHFQGGSVYWSPSTGAHSVTGEALKKWSLLGWENSLLGYPTSDTRTTLRGEETDFEKGHILTTTSGTSVLYHKVGRS